MCATLNEFLKTMIQNWRPCTMHGKSALRVSKCAYYNLNFEIFGEDLCVYRAWPF